MKDFNRIMLIGRLGADPVQKTTPNGATLAQFPLATSRRVKASDGDSDTYNEETQWHRVIAWGKEGENCAQYLKKGNPVFVEGSLRSHKYNGKDGVQRTAFEVHADRVNFLGNPSRPAATTVEAQPSQEERPREDRQPEAETVH